MGELERGCDQLPVTGSRLDELLSRSGYSPAQLRYSERVWTPEGPVSPPVVGFAHPDGPFDTSTATVLADYAPEGRGQRLDQLLKAAVQLAAPVIISSDTLGLTVHSVGAEGDLLFRQDFDWVDSALVHELSPRALLRAKLGHRQGSLFPIDANLLLRARKNTQEALGPRVAQLLDSAADTLGRRPGIDSSAELHTQSARLVIGALTAVVLRDKEDVPSGLTGGALFDLAITRHPSQFTWARSLALWDQELLDEFTSQLSDIDFSFAEPAVLSEIYESRLVDDAARRRLGAHYTPPQLAQKMLALMPFEELPPDSRKVLDPTCGSGTLLLAAHDRLRGLQPNGLPQGASHRELVSSLHGTDIDPVAVEIANLGLLLHALPAGNGWQVSVGDALRQHPRDAFDAVVANPPWKWTNRGRHDDIAHDFVVRMLRRLRPGGLLGVVLPSAWMTRASSADNREFLRRHADIAETWLLPPGTFEGAASGASVVIAKRKHGVRRQTTPLVQRRVDSLYGLQSFYAKGTCSADLLQTPSDSELASGPLTRWWQREARSGLSVSDWADVVSGPQPASPKELGERGVSGGRLSKNAFFLANPGAIPRFARVQRSDLTAISFPGEMQNESRRGEKGLGRRKVLVGAAMSPTQTWRLRVALDETGALARNTASMVIPKVGHGASSPSEDEVLYGLLAFLGSGFASSCVTDTIQTRKIGAPQVRALPAPGPEVMHELAKLGRELADAATNGKTSELAAARTELEEIVWRWSEVPDSLRAVLEARLNGDEPSAPALDWDPRDAWSRPGEVLGVERGGVRLHVIGVTDESGILVRLPMRFPGALLHPGATFTVRLSREADLELAEYEFDSTAYESDDEVLASLMASAGVGGD